MQQSAIAPSKPISLAFAMPLHTMHTCQMAPKSLRSFTTRVVSAPFLQPFPHVCSPVSTNPVSFLFPLSLTLHTSHYRPSTLTATFGLGVNENILSAYSFLVHNYTEGDELFFFGFSRGSFTCRSLAGMISQCGIYFEERRGRRVVRRYLGSIPGYPRGS